MLPPNLLKVSVLSKTKTCDRLLLAANPKLLCNIVASAAAFAATTARDKGLVQCWVHVLALTTKQRVFTCLYTKHTNLKSENFLGTPVWLSA